MKNKETIEKIAEFIRTHKNAAPNRVELIEFNLQDVHVKDSFEVNGFPMQEKALNTVLSHLSAKPSFMEYTSLLKENEWTSIANQLKNARGDINLLGRLSRQPDGMHEIADVFFKNTKKHATEKSQFCWV